MHKNPMRFERPERLKELDIQNTLKKAGITENDIVCDYGAGTGVFTIEAAKYTTNKVIAMDMNQQMLDIISDKVATESLNHVEVVKVDADDIPCEDQTIDLLLLVTVLHEINDIPEFVSEVKRVLKEKGKVMVIDFLKKESPMGPPIAERLSAYQASRHFVKEDIQLVQQEVLGDNLYMILMEAV